MTVKMSVLRILFLWQPSKTSVDWLYEWYRNSGSIKSNVLFPEQPWQLPWHHDLWLRVGCVCTSHSNLFVKPETFRQGPIYARIYKLWPFGGMVKGSGSLGLFRFARSLFSCSTTRCQDSFLLTTYCSQRLQYAVVKNLRGSHFNLGRVLHQFGCGTRTIVADARDHHHYYSTVTSRSWLLLLHSY